eukprot:5389224-Pyramimonas_sp.AAC.1
MLHGGRAVPPFGPKAGEGLAAAHGAPPPSLCLSSSEMSGVLSTASDVVGSSRHAAEDPAPVLLSAGWSGR